MPDSDMKFATARLVCAYLRGNALDLAGLADLIRSTHAALLSALRRIQISLTLSN